MYQRHSIRWEISNFGECPRVELGEAAGQSDKCKENLQDTLGSSGSLWKRSSGNQGKLITYPNYIETLGSPKCVKTSNKILEKFWGLWQKCQMVCREFS